MEPPRLQAEPGKPWKCKGAACNFSTVFYILHSGSAAGEDGYDLQHQAPACRPSGLQGDQLTGEWVHGHMAPTAKGLEAACLTLASVDHKGLAVLGGLNPCYFQEGANPNPPRV